MTRFRIPGAGVNFRDQVPDDADLSYIEENLRYLAVPLDVLVPDPQNANIHDEESIRVIKGSFGLFEQHKPLVANLKGGVPIVRIGNGSLEALRKLGRIYVAVVFTEENEVKATGRAIADNQTARYAQYDPELMGAQLEALKTEGMDISAFGCGEDFVKDLLKQLETPVEVPEGEPQEAPDQVEALVMEIHCPPEIGGELIPKLQAILAVYEARGVTFNVA